MIDLNKLLEDFKRTIDNLTPEELAAGVRSAEFMVAPGPIFYCEYELEDGTKWSGYICALDFCDASRVIAEKVNHMHVPNVEIRPAVYDEWEENQLPLLISPRCEEDW